MTKEDFYLLLATGSWVWLLFVFAFGACVGSLTNVLVYRLPLGLSVVSPPSRCPMCQTKLTWRENFPIFGWLRLGGRCRFCKSPISPEYPLVEALVGLLFVVFFVLWYTLPDRAVILGVDWASIRPEWAQWDATLDRWPRETWPMFIVLLVLVASLVAMSLVDLKTYTIPLQIPWFATVVALLFHVGYAAYLSIRGYSIMPGNPFAWSLPTPVRSGDGWWLVGASIGGVLGLVLANIALHYGWIRRSFADYPEWEAKHAAASARSEATSQTSHSESIETAPVAYEWPEWIPRFGRFVLVTFAVLLGFAAIGYYLGQLQGAPRWAGLLAGVLVGPLVGAISIRGFASPTETAEGGASPAEDWILYPHARREMFKELVFLTPCIGLAWLGGTVAMSQVPSASVIPLWLLVLTGVLMGYLIGGGVVWAARIFGSLAFGKEAMGLGDVHMMAAVGAWVGWIDATLAFPLAALVGLYWVVVHVLATRQMPKAMQFGPYLAMATLLVILAKPLVEEGLTRLVAIPPGEPRINIP